MKIKKTVTTILEGDMTPMIDMTFQLIAFLMVMVNFSADDVSQRIVLPDSALAKPPEGKPPENRVIVQILKTGNVIMGGDELAPERIKVLLANERSAFEIRNIPVSEAVIYIRADKDCPAGRVQDVIKECQMNKFERFVLRAKEKVG